jgi:TRAP-type C4-dicarboxylate transport system substrate-binding protein
MSITPSVSVRFCRSGWIRRCFATLLVATVSFHARLRADEPVVIRLGTILPSGTAQHAMLQELGERWAKDSGGAVKLTLYPDGRLGGEAEMIKKIRIKQLNAGLFSAVGLAEIDRSARGLQVMPLMFRSWDEVDYVRERIRPLLEDRLRAKGFEVLFWADAGWVRFFAKTAAVRPDDFRRLKMFAWAGDPAQLAIMRAIGCQPVPLETTDILLGLNTDMINTVAVPPLIGLAGQFYRPAPHMLEMNWAPIVGATIVRTDVWEKIPAARREAMRASAEAIGVRVRARGRQESEDAIKAMQQHGLQLHPLTPQAELEWRDIATDLHAKIRGEMVPPDIFDAVEKHLHDFRARGASTP